MSNDKSPQLSWKPALVLFAALGALLFYSNSAERRPAAEAIKHIPVHGHRGSRWTHMENTLAALKHAYDAGADFLEFDVRFTADVPPVLVVHHDPNVNYHNCRDPKTGERMSQAHSVEKYRIKSLTLKELREFRCDLPAAEGEPFYFPAQALVVGKLPMETLRIPTLDEVFEAVTEWEAHNPYPERGPVGLHIEIKSPLESQYDTLAPEYEKMTGLELSAEMSRQIEHAQQIFVNTVRKHSMHKRPFFVSAFHPELVDKPRAELQKDEGNQIAVAFPPPVDMYMPNAADRTNVKVLKNEHGNKLREMLIGQSQGLFADLFDKLRKVVKKNDHALVNATAPEFVRRMSARMRGRHGRKVIPWTVDYADEVDVLIKEYEGINDKLSFKFFKSKDENTSRLDGLITDNPLGVICYLQEKGYRQKFESDCSQVERLPASLPLGTDI